MNSPTLVITAIKRWKIKEKETQPCKQKTNKSFNIKMTEKDSK
jgi:hypothetical protein